MTTLPEAPMPSPLDGGSPAAFEVVTFGETMAALRGDGPLRLGTTMQLTIAGAESNVAIGLARLGHRTAWIGRVGADELGELVRRTVRAEDVDTSGVLVDAQHPTGLLLAERRVGDRVRVAYYRTRSAGSTLAAPDVLPFLRPGTRVLHVSGITAALGDSAQDAVATAIARAHDLGVTVSLDLNYRAALWSAAQARRVLMPLLSKVDVLFASEDELPLVAADATAGTTAAAAAIVAAGCARVVVKQGAAGATAYTDSDVTTTPARNVPVCDVVGAGDAFVAGFLSATLDGLDTAASLKRGATTSAFVVACAGDWHGLPARNELGLLDTPDGTTIR